MPNQNLAAAAGLLYLELLETYEVGQWVDLEGVKGVAENVIDILDAPYRPAQIMFEMTRLGLATRNRSQYQIMQSTEG